MKIGSDFMPEDNDVLIQLQTEIAVLKTKNEDACEALKVSHDHFKIFADNLNHRLDGMNEFRLALKDQTASFVTRERFNSVVDFQNKVMGALFAISVALPILFQVIVLFKH